MAQENVHFGRKNANGPPNASTQCKAWHASRGSLWGKATPRPTLLDADHRRLMLRERSSELVHELGALLSRITFFLVFEHHVAAVIRFSQDVCDPPKVGWSRALAARPPNHNFDLHIQGERSRFGEISIGVFGTKVPGVQVHPEPRAVNIAHEG